MVPWGRAVAVLVMVGPGVVPARAVTAQQDTTAPKVVVDESGFWLRSADGQFALHLGGYAQADSRTFLDDNAVPLSNTFLLRRVRLLFEGTVFRYFDFRIMPDWGGGTAVLQDGYI